MKLLKQALIHSTFCLALSSCSNEPKVVTFNLQQAQPDLFECEAAGNRPNLPASHEIDWEQVVTVEQAKTEHEAYVARMVDRNQVVTAYLVEIEGRLFTCQNNMQAQRAFYDDLPENPETGDGE